MENKGNPPHVDLSTERQVREYRIVNGLCHAYGKSLSQGIWPSVPREFKLSWIWYKLRRRLLWCFLMRCCISWTGRIYKRRLIVRYLCRHYQEVMVMLIDPRSSTNFISDHMVNKLGWQWQCVLLLRWRWLMDTAWSVTEWSKMWNGELLGFSFILTLECCLLLLLMLY